MRLFIIPLLAASLFLSGCAIFGYDPPNLTNGESACAKDNMVLAQAVSLSDQDQKA